MRVLFDLGHPAHVHLFRNLAARIQREGGQVLATTRRKDVTVQLCRAYNIPQRVLSRKHPGLMGSAFEFWQRTFKLWRLARRFGPDALLGTSVSIGLVSRLLQRPSFVFSEDDAGVVPAFARVAYPTATYVVTPACLQHEEHGSKHLTYPGYHELAYLHPAHYTPDPEVPRSLGLDPGAPYFILRFVTLNAHHDRQARGLTTEVAKKLVDLLKPKGRVLISSEGQLPSALQPYRFSLGPEKLLDSLACAAMCIGDSQTVAAEAAVLGVPGIRHNSFVGRISYLEELEHVHGLTRGFLPHQAGDLLQTVGEWLSDLHGLRRKMQKRRRAMLSECVNVAEWQWTLLQEKVTRPDPAKPSPYRPVDAGGESDYKGVHHTHSSSVDS